MVPLTAEHLTVASRIMIPAYVLLAAGFGVYYLADPGGRLMRAPAVQAQREVAPLWVWASLLLIVAAGLLVAIASKRRALAEYALGTAAVVWIGWGGSLAYAASQRDDVTMLVPVLPWFVAVAHIASLASLIDQERTLVAGHRPSRR